MVLYEGGLQNFAAASGQGLYPTVALLQTPTAPEAPEPHIIGTGDEELEPLGSNHVRGIKFIAKDLNRRRRAFECIVCSKGQKQM